MGPLYVNTDPNSEYYGKDYYLEAAPNGQEAHVYPGQNHTDYVPNTFENILAGSWSPPSSPTVGSTGGVAAPAPAPTPSPPAASSPNNSDPVVSDVGGIGQEQLNMMEQSIQTALSQQSSTSDPNQVLQLGSSINSQVINMQQEATGPNATISSNQLQNYMTFSTGAAVQSIQNEISTLQNQGGINSSEYNTIEQQYTALNQSVNSSLSSEFNRDPGGGYGDSSSLKNELSSLQSQINALQVLPGNSDSGSGTPPPPGVLGGSGTGGGSSSGGGGRGSGGGGGSSSSGGNGNNQNNGDGGSTGIGSGSPGGGTTNTGDNSTPQFGSVSSAGSGGSGGSSGSSSGGVSTPQSGSGGGATYTVVHGDTMWGIAQANGISLSQLEALNPQISNPRLIVPGETVNLGSGGTGDGSSGSSTSSGSGSTYTVVHGDTLSGIAAANGMTTSQIEALNPQFKDPDLIFPGQSVNLGGSGSGTTTSADPTQAVVNQTQTTTAQQPIGSSGTSTDSGVSGDTSDSGATNTIGFPEKSSYPFGTIGAEAEKALSGMTPNAQAAGWVGGAESESTDIAKQVFEAADDSHSSTDPLKISDVKDQSSSH